MPNIVWEWTIENNEIHVVQLEIDWCVIGVVHMKWRTTIQRCCCVSLSLLYNAPQRTWIRSVTSPLMKMLIETCMNIGCIGWKIASRIDFSLRYNLPLFVNRLCIFSDGNTIYVLKNQISIVLLATQWIWWRTSARFNSWCDVLLSWFGFG